MKKMPLINEENGRDMQNWYVEKLGYAVRHAAFLKDHILSLGEFTRHINGSMNPYEQYGVYCKIREHFDELVRYLLTAYEYSYGCDRCDGSLMMLKLLKEHDFDPEAVFAEDDRVHQEAMAYISSDDFKRYEEMLFGKTSQETAAETASDCSGEDCVNVHSAADEALATAKSARIEISREKYPHARQEDIERLVDLEMELITTSTFREEDME